MRGDWATHPRKIILYLIYIYMCIYICIYMYIYIFQYMCINYCNSMLWYHQLLSSFFHSRIFGLILPRLPRPHVLLDARGRVIALVAMQRHLHEGMDQLRRHHPGAMGCSSHFLYLDLLYFIMIYLEDVFKFCSNFQVAGNWLRSENVRMYQVMY